MFITVVYVIIEVEYSVGRAMGYQDIGIRGNFSDVTLLAVGDAVAHKHWHAVEFHSVELYTGVAQVVYIGVKAADIRAVEAIVVIAADENLMGIGQVTEPV